MEEEQRHPALLRHANGYKDDGEDEEGAITGTDGKGRTTSEQQAAIIRQQAAQAGAASKKKHAGEWER
jgi:hypothetical protein